MHPDFSKAKIEKNVRNLREQIRYMNVSMTSWEATPLRQKIHPPCKGTSQNGAPSRYSEPKNPTNTWSRQDGWWRIIFVPPSKMLRWRDGREIRHIQDFYGNTYTRPTDVVDICVSNTDRLTRTHNQCTPRKISHNLWVQRNKHTFWSNLLTLRRSSPRCEQETPTKRREFTVFASNFAPPIGRRFVRIFYNYWITCSYTNISPLCINMGSLSASTSLSACTRQLVISQLTNCMAGERHGKDMGAAWARHAMCESAFSPLSSTDL